jgi:hypothetical protein
VRFMKGRQYRHASTLDMDLLMASYAYPASDGLVVKAWLVNRRSGDLYWPNAVRFRIKYSELHLWRIVE